MCSPSSFYPFIFLQINKVSEVKLKNKRRRMKPKQDFWLTDGTDSVQVCLWDKDIQQLRDKSVGDIVRVTNVRTSRYYDTTSLNSTFYTRIIKVQLTLVTGINMKTSRINTIPSPIHSHYP